MAREESHQDAGSGPSRQNGQIVGTRKTPAKP